MAGCLDSYLFFLDHTVDGHMVTSASTRQHPVFDPEYQEWCRSNNKILNVWIEGI